jgi:hypothetical protein
VLLLFLNKALSLVQRKLIGVCEISKTLTVFFIYELSHLGCGLARRCGCCGETEAAFLEGNPPSKKSHSLIG